MDGVGDTKAQAVLRERNRRVFASPFGAVYDFYMQREWLRDPSRRLGVHVDLHEPELIGHEGGSGSTRYPKARRARSTRSSGTCLVSV